MFRTHADAPRVLIANSNLVGKWATWEHFRELEAQGLMMYGQMTAGSWIYIGSQGILQGTYETFVAARQDALRNATSTGRFVLLTAGLGGMGGAQPLAATMAGARVPRRRGRSRAHPAPARDALPRRGRAAISTTRCARVDEASAKKQPRSVALVGNAAEVYAELVRRGVTPDLVTDQTAAHDPLVGYIPQGFTLERGRRAARAAIPRTYVAPARASMAGAGRGDARDEAARAPHVFDYGNNMRAQAELGGGADATRLDIPGFVPAYIRPLFCEGKGPFRWVALSGDPDDIRVTDEAVLDEVPDDPMLRRWIELAREQIAFQGLPARICWLGYGERAPRRPARSTSSCAPARSRRRSSSAATTSTAARSRRRTARPRRMKDGTDAVADWAILNALVNTAAGATLGELPSRRRRRHRLLAARGHGRRRRRHRRAPRRASSAC